MSKKTAQERFPEKYLEIMKKFHLTPDFKLSDLEKDTVKAIDEAGSMTAYNLADAYDLRPSEVKELVDPLVEKGLLNIENGIITLTAGAIQYLHASKEERKAEKKFRKFLNTLDEKDIDKFMGLVNSFKFQEAGKEIKEVKADVALAAESVKKETNKAIKKETKKVVKKAAVKVAKKVVKKKVDDKIQKVDQAVKKANQNVKTAVKKAGTNVKKAVKKVAPKKQPTPKKETAAPEKEASPKKEGE